MKNAFVLWLLHQHKVITAKASLPSCDPEKDYHRSYTCNQYTVSIYPYDSYFRMMVIGTVGKEAS